MSAFSPNLTIAVFALVQLREYRELPPRTTPEGFDSLTEWLATIDEMIFALEWSIQHLNGGPGAEHAQQGLELFGKHFLQLWS